MPVQINNKTYFRTSEACYIAHISRITLLRCLKDDSLDEPNFRDRHKWHLFTEKDVKTMVSEANRTCEAQSRYRKSLPV